MRDWRAGVAEEEEEEEKEEGRLLAAVMVQRHVLEKMSPNST